MSLDPRLDILDRRLEGVERIVAVTGGKGGIGKSTIAAGLALTLADNDQRVGLLDLDFCGPSAHVVLGGGEAQPTEAFGLVPPLVHGIRFMSLVHFTGQAPTPLRGEDVSNAMIELLSVTQWGELDYLVVDLPPGISDSILDTVRLLKRAEFLVVTTPSRMAVETVRKTLALLRRLDQSILGLVENLRRSHEPSATAALAEYAVPLLATVDFDAGLETALGDVEALRQTRVLQQLAPVVAVLR